MYSFHLLKSDSALTAGKHTQMTKEDSKGMKDLNASNLSQVSRKPLQCIPIAAQNADRVVEVKFRNYYNAYCMFSDGTRLSSSLLKRVMFYSKQV